MASQRRQEPRRLMFTIQVDILGGGFLFKTFRDQIRKTVNSFSGVRFVDIHTEMSPDPYLFEDPDNPPEGAQ